MSVEQLEKPITYDVKQEAEKIPATEKSSEAAEDKEKGGFLQRRSSGEILFPLRPPGASNEPGPMVGVQCDEHRISP
ncbi:hypothetical protein DY000_02011202 [Brassica cretica]|uniref:Remorin N-terminal domain-containing protein n=1 Tax=Brassica cretica TaxID=69181 RepID=A0ABQ7CQY9_BRACR|nr:hypothetical protein DY000_02011202 [Brassica cretica]